MTQEQYIKSILKRIRADKNLKTRLREDMTQDIEARLQSGQTLEDVLAQMGTPEQVAAEIIEEYGVKRSRNTAEIILLTLTALSAITSGIFAAVLAYQQWNWFTPDRLLESSIGIIGGADGPTTIFVTGTVNWIPVFIPLLAAVLFYVGYRILRKK